MSRSRPGHKRRATLPGPKNQWTEISRQGRREKRRLADGRWGTWDNAGFAGGSLIPRAEFRYFHTTLGDLQRDRTGAFVRAFSFNLGGLFLSILTGRNGGFWRLPLECVVEFNV